MAIGEDFHNQVSDGKVRTTLYKVLEEHYTRGGLDHKELAGRLATMQQLERGVQLGATGDDSEDMVTHRLSIN